MSSVYVRCGRIEPWSVDVGANRSDCATFLLCTARGTTGATVKKMASPQAEGLPESATMRRQFFFQSLYDDLVLGLDQLIANQIFVIAYCKFVFSFTVGRQRANESSTPLFCAYSATPFTLRRICVPDHSLTDHRSATPSEHTPHPKCLDHRY